MLKGRNRGPQKEPAALGEELARAASQLLPHDAGFVERLHQARPLLFRGTVVAVQTSGSARQVQVQRTGQTSADAYWYPVFDAGYSPAVGDDVLLLSVDRRMSACVIGARTRGMDAYAGGTLAVGSSPGAERAYEYTAGSAPANWYTLGFDDSAWTTSVADAGSGMPPPFAGSSYVTYATGGRANTAIELFRRPFDAPAGLAIALTIEAVADNFFDAIYLNGTTVYSGPSGLNATVSVSVAPTLLVAGGRNLLAIQISNLDPFSGANWMRLDYLLSATYAGASDLVAVSGAGEGDLAVYTGGAWERLPIGASGTVLSSTGTDPAWASPGSGSGVGTVTSVGLSGPTGTSVSGSPITASGTIGLSWSSESANVVLASPDNASGAPTFRALVGRDVPVDASTIVSSAGVIKGNYQAGTGVSISGNTISATGSGGSVTSVALTAPALFSVSGSPVTSSGTLTLAYASGQQLPAAQGGLGLDASGVADGQIAIGRSSDHTFGLATITAGSGITVTNAGHGITLSAATGAGGSGNVINTGAIGSEPSSPATGDLYFPNNAPVVERYSGSAWVPWGPLFPLTKPPSQSTFSWDNQGTATATDAQNGLVLAYAGSDSGNGLHVLYKSAPATPYSVTACFLMTANVDAFAEFGLILRESSTGKIKEYALIPQQDVLTWRKWTTSTSFSATYVNNNSNGRYFHPGGPLYLRISDDGTNNTVGWSRDGINFITWTSNGRTDFCTPNQIGTVIRCSSQAYITVFHWAVA